MDRRLRDIRHLENMDYRISFVKKPLIRKGSEFRRVAVSLFDGLGGIVTRYTNQDAEQPVFQCWLSLSKKSFDLNVLT